jgi:hypothetical protein
VLNSPRKTDYVDFGSAVIARGSWIRKESNCLVGDWTVNATEHQKKLRKTVHSTSLINKKHAKVCGVVKMKMCSCVAVCENTCIGDEGTLEGRSIGSLMHSESLPSGLCCIGCGGGCCTRRTITKVVKVSLVNSNEISDAF